MAHATAEELADEPYNLTPANAQLLLDRASRDVDQALLTSFYDPTNPDVVAALKAATLEQIAGNLDAGQRTGSGAERPSSGFTLGRLSVQRGAAGGTGSGQAGKVHGLWPQAWAVLQQAGLTGFSPQTW